MEKREWRIVGIRQASKLRERARHRFPAKDRESPRGRGLEILDWHTARLVSALQTGLRKLGGILMRSPIIWISDVGASLAATVSLDALATQAVAASDASTKIQFRDTRSGEEGADLYPP